MRVAARACAETRRGERHRNSTVSFPDPTWYFDVFICLTGKAVRKKKTRTYIIHILIYNKKTSPEKRALSLEEDKGQVLKNPLMYICARACCQIWPLNKMSLVLPWQQGMKSLSKTFTFSFGMSCQPLPKLLKPVAEDNFSAWTTHIPMHLCQTFAFLPCSSLFSNIIR